MDYYEFLNKVIDEGINAATADYSEASDKNQLDGSIAGFNACKNLLPEQLFELWTGASAKANNAFGDTEEIYWYNRCFQLEVEWVCNVVSAMMVNEGQDPIFSWLPTVNGAIKAASIIGVTERSLL